MSQRSRILRFHLSAFMCIILLSFNSSSAADDVELYTPYLRISVPPGQSIDYTIDLINNSKVTKSTAISIKGMPAGWNYTLKAGGYDIRELSVLPGEKKNINFKVDVPIKVSKGSYRFQLVAGQLDTLNLTIVVSEQGTFKTEFTTTQSNMEGSPTSTLNYQAVLRNRTADPQHYALSAGTPPGWSVVFRANYKQATSVDVLPNAQADIAIDIDPADRAEAGTYKIPVVASSNATSEKLELEAVITGTFGMVLTTPTSLLSTNITAGEKKRIDLVLNNTGSADLKNIKLTSSSPINWEVVFEPANVEILRPGESTQLAVIIKAYKKAIAGDYVTNLEAAATETSSKAIFRVTVKTPMIWGWVGIFIIIGALASVYYLFRKYGRR